MKMLDLELSPRRFETPQILRKVATAGRKLAELKGLASSIPDQKILIHTLGIQEARDSSAIADYRQRIREGCRFYRAELVDNLFMNPYTKIDFVARDLQVSRLTATKYLDILCSGGFLEKRRAGRGNYYVNIALNRILAGSP